MSPVMSPKLYSDFVLILCSCSYSFSHNDGLRIQCILSLLKYKHNFISNLSHPISIRPLQRRQFLFSKLMTRGLSWKKTKFLCMQLCFQPFFPPPTVIWRETSTEPGGSRFPSWSPTSLCDSLCWHLSKDHTETFYLVYDVLMAVFFNELNHGGLPENEDLI